MKVGLLTLDAQIYNYGGLLQEYALYKLLSDMGYNVEIINYDVSSELNTFSLKRSIKYISIEKLIRQILKKVTNYQRYQHNMLNMESRELFDCFRNNKMKISRRYCYSDLSDIEEMYDTFICGSDQIWNPSYNIPSFFLKFVKEKNKIIYAASLGVSKLNRMEKLEYKKLLNGLSYISVRESQAKTIIQQLTTENVKIVLDPTMILDKKDWMPFIRCDRSIQPYVFCYFLGNDKTKIDAAERFAYNNHLKTVYIPFERNVANNKEKTKDTAVGPIEFLNLIYNSEFVLTDSFHASVFSILFNKDFRVFDRHIGTLNMNDRLYTLLDLVDIKDHFILPNKLDSVKINNSVTYQYLKIEKLKKDSIQWLHDAIIKSEIHNSLC